MESSANAKLKLIVSMAIFGTIGIFVRTVPFPSGMIALVRGIVGTLFLLMVTLIKKERLSGAAIRSNLVWLILSGACLGFNWMLLFESYRYTSVATSTLCYYMAPILVIFVSPVLLKEPLTLRKIGCVVVALAGTVCISGVLRSGLPSAGELKGILLGLGAAVLYACIILINKRIHHISAYDKTIMQLGISAVVLLPYCLMTVSVDVAAVTTGNVLLLLLVGVLHTGITYLLYFGAMEHIEGQTVAIISYIDPVVAVLISVLILREPMQLTEGLGSLLILGAALLSELSPKAISLRKASDKSMTEVVAALIWDGPRFLACQRPAHKARGLLWEFVGGKVEPGETKEDALIRECREELAVTVAVDSVFADVVHEYPDLTVHLTLYNARIVSGSLQKIEHNDLNWITAAEIDQYEFCPADKEILERLKQL